MTLKFEVDTIEGLDELIAAEYSKDDASGKYFLNVDGAVHKRKLDEFRENNVKLLKEKDDLLASRVEKSELERLQEQYNTEKAQLAEELEKLKAKKEEVKEEAPTKDNSDELKQLTKQIKQLEAIKKAQDNDIAQIKSELTQKLSDYEAQLQKKSQAYSQVLLNSAVNEAAASVGVDPSALPALKALANATFKVENDALTAYDDTGSPMFSKDGTSSLSVKEWATNLKSSMPQLFIQPVGAGTQKTSTVGSLSNDNLTPLQRIQQGLSGGKK
jgi:DNA repair ATPase RecN